MLQPLPLTFPPPPTSLHHSSRPEADIPRHPPPLYLDNVVFNVSPGITGPCIPDSTTPPPQHPYHPTPPTILAPFPPLAFGMTASRPGLMTDRAVFSKQLKVSAAWADCEGYRYPPVPTLTHIPTVFFLFPLSQPCLKGLEI